MTAEADEVINEVEPGVVYVIGGMVDRNRLPGICHERAKKMNLKTKRIPIRENIKFNARCVLTVNHVFEILLNRMNGKSWQKSLLSVLPNRKIELSENSEQATVATETETRTETDQLTRELVER